MNAPRPESSNDEIDSAAAAWVVRCDAGLTDAQREAFERWRAADPRHAGAFAWHEKAWSTLDRPRAAGHSDYAMREYRARAARRRRKRVKAVAAVAAICLAVVLLRPVWRSSGLFPAGPAERFAVVSPELQQLSDGSRVELRPGAAIKVDFDEHHRLVTLQRGEAHFQVAKQAERPFVVKVAGVEVRAVGTAFSVQLNSDQIEVLVTEGRVAVDRERPPSAAHSPQEALGQRESEAIVDAGNRVVVSLPSSPRERTAPQVMPLPESELNERLAWRRTHLEFSDTPLEEAVELLNRYAGDGAPHLVVGDSAAARIPINGFFRADNSEVLVRLLEASTGIETERVGNTVILLHPR